MTATSDHDHDHDHDHEHEHEHEHDHEHGEHEHGPDCDHDHGHDEEHVDPRERPELPRGAGKGSILFLDAPSGIAGDMTIAALVDLGVPEEVIVESLVELPVRGYHLHFGAAEESGIVARTFGVHLEEEQPQRNYKQIRKMLERAKLEPRVKEIALATFAKLAESESEVHARPLDEVHFHEVGAVDAIVDVVGSAAALAWLGAEVWVSPLPMGRGFTRAAHGVLPLPAPATVRCLAGFDTYDGGLDFEFVTPTGAAIVAANAKGSVRWPAFRPNLVGWSAGSKSLKNRPNVLRAVLGKATPKPETRDEERVVLDTNIDDSTGELLGHAIRALEKSGALDVWIVPTVTKKGRPGYVLSALARPEDRDAVARAFFDSTTSVGLRETRVLRTPRPRRVENVKTKYGIVPVKISAGDGATPTVKPEFDVCEKLAREAGVSVRVVLREATVKAAKLHE